VIRLRMVTSSMNSAAGLYFGVTAPAAAMCQPRPVAAAGAVMGPTGSGTIFPGDKGGA